LLQCGFIRLCLKSGLFRFILCLFLCETGGFFFVSLVFIGNLAG
jgi:hypothetical protein